MMVGAFYNPHLAPDLLSGDTGIDHLAMADPPRADDHLWPEIRKRYTLLLHDYLGQLSDPFDEASIERARGLAEMYSTPWVAEHFQVLHTQNGSHSLNYVFPPLYTEEFLERFVSNAIDLQSHLDQPLVMENIPGFFDVRVDQIPEPVWLSRFFDATGCGFLLDLPHVWLQAHYRQLDPREWLDAFPLDHVVEIHVAGIEQDDDLKGPWIAAGEPPDEMLDFMLHALGRCPQAQAVTFDAFSPSLDRSTLMRTIERIRSRL